MNFLIKLIPKKIKRKFKDSRFNFHRVVLHQLVLRILHKSSYSHSKEDEILQTLLTSPTGFYIDVGSGRPISGSNTFVFYRKGWRGICIDPISLNIRLFNLFRPKDKILQALVGLASKPVDFWEFDPYEYSTANKAVAERVMENADFRLLKTSKLITVSLSSLISLVPRNVSTLLSIDVEGHEMEVLESNDWELFRPTVICVEEWQSTFDSLGESEIQLYLSIRGYKKVAYIGVSSIYLNQNSNFKTS